MKHKIPLLLVFTIILTHSLYGQVVRTSHWGEDGVVVDLNGCFHGGPFGSYGGPFDPSIGPTVCGDVYWYGDTAAVGDGQYTTTGDANLGISVGDGVSVSVGVGATATYTFEIQPLDPGNALLLLRCTNNYQVVGGFGGTSTMVLGTISKDHPGKLYDEKDGHEIDPTKPRNSSDNTNKTQDQIDKENAARAAGGIVTSYSNTMVGDAFLLYTVGWPDGARTWYFSDGSNIRVGAPESPEYLPPDNPPPPNDPPPQDPNKSKDDLNKKKGE